MIRNIRNKGFTLMELIVTLTIFSISMLMLGVYFEFDYTIRKQLIEGATFTRDARIAMHHMTMFLRYADPNTVNVNITSNTAYIEATIMGGYLPEHPLHDNEDAQVCYFWASINYPSINYTAFSLVELRGSWAGSPLGGGVISSMLASNITSFTPEQDAGNPNLLTLNMTVPVGTKTLPLDTKIIMMGDM
jgi:prepilin-type N-terminal cleavage/methylation domain-containing protein